MTNLFHKSRLTSFISLLLLSIGLSANCAQNTTLREINHSSFELTEKTTWFKTSDKPIGVILLIHGLNLKPSKMNELAKYFQSSGYDVLRAALIGHRGSLKEQEQVTAQQWLTQLQQHSCLLTKRSEELGGAPVFLTAFSLGSLVAMAWQSQHQKPFFKSQVLLAPAAFAHWYGDLTKTLFFLKDSFGLPSKNLIEYRSQDSTSLAAYRSMQDLRGIIEKSKKAVLNLDTLIFLDPEDELVSLEKLEEFKKQNKMSNWKIETITNSKPTLKKSFHHLIIDKPSLGSHYWQELKALSIRQLGP